MEIGIDSFAAIFDLSRSSLSSCYSMVRATRAERAGLAQAGRDEGASMPDGTAGILPSNINLFADISLRDPFADYRRMRDLGVVVKLDVPDVFAISRFDDVGEALRASDVS